MKFAPNLTKNNKKYKKDLFTQFETGGGRKKEVGNINIIITREELFSFENDEFIFVSLAGVGVLEEAFINVKIQVCKKRRK